LRSVQVCFENTAHADGFRNILEKKLIEQNRHKNNYRLELRFFNLIGIHLINETPFFLSTVKNEGILLLKHILSA